MTCCDGSDGTTVGCAGAWSPCTDVTDDPHDGGGIIGIERWGSIWFGGRGGAEVGTGPCNS